MTVKEDPSKSIPEEVPVFLRKTYVMIDTSPKDIAGWDETGEMFIIKDPDLFEQTIIPQFFKHSKFSSFVRQLNFYSFRKLKNVDMIRIDPKLEAETANHWRFRHENFRQGRPDLLPHIKRTNGPKSAPKDKKGTSTTNGAATTTTTSPGPSIHNTEVLVLKKRIEEMSKHMDELTSMVKKVSLKQEEHENEYVAVEPGSKRKKHEDSHTKQQAAIADDALMEFDLDSIPEVDLAGLPKLDLDEKEEATPSDFEALFGAEEEVLEVGAAVMPNDNKPDAVLMERLSEALMLLPREIQEIIVEKLIDAITSSSLPGKKVSTHAEKIPHSVDESAEEDETALPLAASTLAALLQHCGAQLSGKTLKSLEKSIPVIPIHA